MKTCYRCSGEVHEDNFAGEVAFRFGTFPFCSICAPAVACYDMGGRG